MVAVRAGGARARGGVGGDLGGGDSATLKAKAAALDASIAGAIGGASHDADLFVKQHSSSLSQRSTSSNGSRGGGGGGGGGGGLDFLDRLAHAESQPASAER